MKRILIAVVLAAFALTTAARAADFDWAAWKAKLSSDVSIKEKAVSYVVGVRDARCPGQPTPAMRNACVAAHDLFIERRQLEIKHLKAMLAAAELPPGQRDEMLTTIASADDYNVFQARTSVIGPAVDKMFPLRSSELEKH